MKNDSQLTKKNSNSGVNDKERLSSRSESLNKNLTRFKNSSQKGSVTDRMSNKSEQENNRSLNKSVRTSNSKIIPNKSKVSQSELKKSTVSGRSGNKANSISSHISNSSRKNVDRNKSSLSMRSNKSKINSK